MKNKILIGLLMAATVFAAGCGDVDFSVTNSKPVTQETGDLNLNYALGDLVKLGKYSGIDLHKKETVVGEKEIIARMMTKASSFKDTNFTTKDTQILASGDIVNINFEGFVDGAKESLDSTTAKNFVLGLGSGSFIEGFEDQLIGHKVGEPEFDINVTFPENYGEESMAGKPARFVIKINGVVRDKDVEANTGVKTVTEWKEAIKKEISTEMDERAKLTLKEEAIVAVSSLSMARRFPEALLKKYKQNRMENLYEPYAEQMGMSVEELLDQYGITDEVLASEAQRDMLKEMVVTAVAKKEKITVTAEELKTAREEVIGEGKQFADEKAYNEANADELLIGNLLYDKVISLIVEKANVIVLNEEEYSKLLNKGMVEDPSEEELEVEADEEEVMAEEVDEAEAAPVD